MYRFLGPGRLGNFDWFGCCCEHAEYDSIWWEKLLSSFLARWKSVKPGILSSICTGLRIPREVGSQQHLIPCDMTMEKCATRDECRECNLWRLYHNTWVGSLPLRDRNDGKRKGCLIVADGSPCIQLVFPDKPKIKPHAI